MLPYFFGYGSLVNTGTHDYPDARRAHVTGWRRLWRHTNRRAVAYLTVHRVEGAEIDGLIAHVPNSDWAQLDVREAAYDRVGLAHDAVRHDHPDPIDVQLYRTKDGQDAAPTTRHPILQSYLDTVTHGYFHQFGAEGLERFFDTTDGWAAPVLDDRSAPIYPRTTAASKDLQRQIDQALDKRSVPRLTLSDHVDWRE